MYYYISDLIPDPFNRRVLLSIIAVVSVYGLSIGFIYPLISLKMESRGFSPFIIGVMGMMPFIASIIVSPLIPVIIRSFNVTLLVLLSICVDLAMILLMVIFEDLYVWYICRFVMGIAGSLLFVVSETWINEIAEDRTRGRILALYTLAFSATLGVSPIFIVIFGVEGPLPFIMAFVMIALALIPLYWTRGSSPDFSGGTVSHVLKFMILAPTLVGAAALMSFEEAAIVTLFPVYALKSGVSTEWAALFLTVIAVGSMVAQPLIGSLADRMNRYYLLFACAFIMLISVLMIPFLISTKIAIWLVLIHLGRCHCRNLYGRTDHHGAAIPRCPTGSRQCGVRRDVGCLRHNRTWCRRCGDDCMEPERIDCRASGRDSSVPCIGVRTEDRNKKLKLTSGISR